MKQILIFVFLVLALYSVCDAQSSILKYRNHREVTQLLRYYSNKYPTKTYLYSIGKSVKEKQLWVLALSETKPREHVKLRPEVKYISTIHGNEVSGREILLRFIEVLLVNPEDNPDVSYLMKNMRIHILIEMNPDGFEMAEEGDCQSVKGRYNALGFDLNRSFPDLIDTNTNPLQAETKAVINWMNNNDFILSGTFHGGSMVINYPLDNYKNANEIPKESPTKDDDVVKSIAKAYSLNHLTMINSTCNVETFKDGIVNGASWYPVTGGMQDYNYLKHGCIDVTIELTCCKYPKASELENIWEDNKMSLIEYLKQANKGVKGIVKFANGIPAKFVTVKIDSRAPYFKTNKNGEYYRILLPGTYNLELLFGCSRVYKSKIKITEEQELLVFNVTLPNSLYRKYKTSKFNKYPTFC